MITLKQREKISLSLQCDIRICQEPVYRSFEVKEWPGSVNHVFMGAIHCREQKHFS